MLWDKGVAEFVAAAEQLRGKARFILVGGTDSGNPTSVPERRLIEWARDGAIEWWGHREDMPAVLQAATIVCLPSYREGMPKALLEACVVGRPIVTTDVPGCRDVLTGGDYGITVPPRDAAALTRAIASLLGDRPRLVRMAESAALSSSRFCVTDVVTRTLDVYRALLDSSARPSRRSASSCGDTSSRALSTRQRTAKNGMSGTR